MMARLARMEQELTDEQQERTVALRSAHEEAQLLTHQVDQLRATQMDEEQCVQSAYCLADEIRVELANSQIALDELREEQGMTGISLQERDEALRQVRMMDAEQEGSMALKERDDALIFVQQLEAEKAAESSKLEQLAQDLEDKMRQVQEHAEENTRTEASLSVANRQIATLEKKLWDLQQVELLDADRAAKEAAGKARLQELAEELHDKFEPVELLDAEKAEKDAEHQAHQRASESPQECLSTAPGSTIR